MFRPSFRGGVSAPNLSTFLVSAGRPFRWDPVRHWRVLLLRRRTRRRAKKTLDEVWAAFGDHCLSCGQPREALIQMGIGRHAHHILPYVQNGHARPVVPICTLCHEVINALQRLMSRLSMVQKETRRT